MSSLTKKKIRARKVIVACIAVVATLGGATIALAKLSLN